MVQNENCMGAREPEKRVRTRKGLDIPLKGEPHQVMYSGPPVAHVALVGQDYPGLKPALLVAQGDQVSAGQALFADRRDPAVTYVAPASGTVIGIHRGARRHLEAVVIECSNEQEPVHRFDRFTIAEIERLDGVRIAEQLQRAGLWPAFRTRPYGLVPRSDSRPVSIFVTAIDTRPWAPDPRLVIADQLQAFTQGLRALTRLCQRSVWLCTGVGWAWANLGVDSVQWAEFSGPHPAGLVGTHIHHLDPAGAEQVHWHIDYPDVVAIGRLFQEGVLSMERVVALAGAPVSKPRLVRTVLGASLSEITAGQVETTDPFRIISGCVLSGRAAAGHSAYLGRYHKQVSILQGGGNKQLFGWLASVSGLYTAAGMRSGRTLKRRSYKFSAAMNGRPGSMLPVEIFEGILPMDILPSPLLRALLSRDIEQAIALGCLELDEEDLALCSFLCPAKNDYGAALRINLDELVKEL